MLINFFNNASSIILREKLSADHLRSIGYKGKYFVSTDIAFILKNNYALKKQIESKNDINNVVFCFRKWNGNSNTDLIKTKSINFCKYFLKKNKQNTITFISTCQGIENYVDDSIFAEEIVSELTFFEKSRCEIINEKLTVSSLINKLQNYDAYIGMRLHGAILSLLSGIPALNIGYEDKTKGIYDTMGYNKYCFSYKEEFDVWINTLNFFINDNIKIKESMPGIIDQMYQRSYENVRLLNID
jgi:polysaccharide pyruvyl transferase WcaK-like protein